MFKLKNYILSESTDKNQIISNIDKKYPLAKSEVDGREVLNKVDNTSSISASLDNYFILKGIREIPISEFTLSGTHYSVEGTKRIENLANQILQSGTISPLIVVIDKDGPYILEGSHRIESLYLIKAKSFPALVVIDTDNI